MKYILIAFTLFSMGCSVVGPQDRGIRLVSGAATEALQPGMYLWLPVLYGIAKVDVSIQKSEIQTSAASKDLQEVTTTVAVNWSISPDNVVDVYKNVGHEKDMLHRIIEPAVNEILKSATAKKTAEEILTKRLELKAEIDDQLNARLKQYHVRASDLSIVNLRFSEGFTRAIEAKQIAEQNAKQASYTAQQKIEEAKGAVNEAKGRAESNLMLAKAQAESQRLLQQTVTPAILQLKAIEKWNGIMPQFTGSGNMMFNIPTKGVSRE